MQFPLSFEHFECKLSRDLITPFTDPATGNHLLPDKRKQTQTDLVKVTKLEAKAPPP